MSLQPPPNAAPSVDPEAVLPHQSPPTAAVKAPALAMALILRRRRTKDAAAEKWVPNLVIWLVASNIVMFIVTMYVNDCPTNYGKCFGAAILGRFSFQPLKENYLIGPSTDTLEKLGAFDTPLAVDGHQWWRFFSSMWLHGGVIHVLANMFVLVMFGIPLEEEFGYVRIGLLYLISGLGSDFLSALFMKNVKAVGASGAICGLIGGMLSELITNWTIYTHKVPSLMVNVVNIVGIPIMAFFPRFRVDNFGHYGGIISGFLLGFVLLMRPQLKWKSQIYDSSEDSISLEKPKFNGYQYILWIVSLALLIVGFTFATILVLRGVDLNAYCCWCHYLNCIPIGKWKCDFTQPVSCYANRYP